MKRRLTDLAILGGEPAFISPLHVGYPNIGDRGRFLDLINDMLDRRRLTNDGPYVQELERRIAEFLGVRHCVALSSGTVALEIMARALNLSGEVIIPSFTFVATAHALQWLGITPVFCDVAPGQHHMDPEIVEGLVTPRTTGIIGVHIWGDVYGIERLQAIADQHNLCLVFDASHAFGVSHADRMVGNFGEAEAFSFHATKVFNTLEGGAITTNNDVLAERIRVMRNFGFTGYDQVDHLGINGKMSEVSAAMGLTSLEDLEDFIAVNKRNYRAYQYGLANRPGLTLRKYNNEVDKHNYQYVVVEVDAAQTEISRDVLVDVLHAENVLARRYFYPGCHQMEPYRSLFPLARQHMRRTESLVERTLVLPNGTAVGADDIRQICEVLHMAVVQSSELLHHLHFQG